MTDIEWARNRDGSKGKVWNPVIGCSRVSPGCEHCYAERFAHRGLSERHRGLTVLGKHGPRWTGEVRAVPEALEAPLRWRKPQVVFVNSMSDLFHERVPFEFIAAVFGVMAACPQHTFIVLTKRDPRRWFEWVAHRDPYLHEEFCQRGAHRIIGYAFPLHTIKGTFKRYPWPLPNVVLGVSCENQEAADIRIPWLLQTPAATRVVSLEPLLGPLELGQWLSPCSYYCDHSQEFPNGHHPERSKLDCVIVGGESGPGARPCNVEWIRDIVRQCREAGTKCFVKQLGAHVEIPNTMLEKYSAMRAVLKNRKGADPSEWPEDLRVRELPWITP